KSNGCLSRNFPFSQKSFRRGIQTNISYHTLISHPTLQKRPRPQSIHEQAESENDRPFAYKRDRKQSKGFQGLIEKEPVTNSPFRLQPSRDENHQLSPAPASPVLQRNSPLPHTHLPNSTPTRNLATPSPPPVPAKDSFPKSIQDIAPRPSS